MIQTTAHKSLAAEAEGAAVVVNYASSKSGADKTVSEIIAAGGKAVAVGGDVSKSAEVQGIIDADSNPHTKNPTGCPIQHTAPL